MKTNLLIFLGLSAIAGSALAQSANQCGNMVVQIANNTQQNCALFAQSINHGNVNASQGQVPVIIRSGKEASFEMSQTVFGPSIDLGYKCGSKKAVFRSSQGLCLGWASYVYPDVLEYDGLIVTNVAQSPSNLHGTHGVIKWVISEIE